VIRSVASRVDARVARWLVLSLLCAGCTPTPRVVIPQTNGQKIATITLGLSNVHVLFGEHVVLVDTGSPGEGLLLDRGLRELGVKRGDVTCAVVTHGHSDHAGNARWLQMHGVKIIGGAADLGRFINGAHGKLKSTSLFARLLKPAIPKHYEPFWPDVRVHEGERYDLRACGVEGEVVVMPAHTAGSLVVLVGGGKIALVGDLFRGGALAGYVHPSSPKEHFYQDDIPLVHRQIRALLDHGVEWFVLGHGGPSRRADVEKAFR
jgi:hydroxyacylglutathione hydrolase